MRSFAHLNWMRFAGGSPLAIPLGVAQLTHWVLWAAALLVASPVAAELVVLESAADSVIRYGTKQGTNYGSNADLYVRQNDTAPRSLSVEAVQTALRKQGALVRKPDCNRYPANYDILSSLE